MAEKPTQQPGGPDGKAKGPPPPSDSTPPLRRRPLKEPSTQAEEKETTFMVTPKAGIPVVNGNAIA